MTEAVDRARELLTALRQQLFDAKVALWRAQERYDRLCDTFEAQRQVWMAARAAARDLQSVKEEE